MSLSLNKAQPVFLAYLIGVGTFLAILWSFLPTLVTMADRWANDPRYSHGYLVPLFSIYLLWSRRNLLVSQEFRPHWLGLPLLLIGFVTRGVGIAFYVDWLAAAALLPCLAGLALIVGGRSCLKWSWPAIAFLLFMVPLPFKAEVALAHPLQRIATISSVYLLQTLGFIATGEGNTIRMSGGIQLGVVEACSGLSMLMNFFALSTAAAVVLRRPMYERILLILAAIPIALIANITRITVTGVLHKTLGSEIANRVFHDFAGWLMMPLGLALLWIGLCVMSRLIVDKDQHQTLPRGLTPPR